MYLYENISAASADFSGSPTSGTPPLTVSFTDESTNNPTSWKWVFGDGSVENDTQQNPVHVYSSVGSYDVSLTATNATGYNIVNKTDYITVANASGFVRQDIMMDPAYTITFRAKDGNGAYITSTNTTFIITASDGTETDLSTNTGIATGTFGYGLYSVVAAATGYTSASTTFIAYADRTITLTLATASTSNENTNTLYAAKTIGITVTRRNPSGQHVPNAPIYLTAIGSTLPYSDTQGESLQALYGVNPTAANILLNNTLIMSGTTGGDGSAGFTVLSTIGYNLTVVDPDDGSAWYSTLYPSDPTGLYTVWIGETAINAAENVSLNQLNNTALYVTEPNASFVTFNLRYQDHSGATTNLKFYVRTANNMTKIYEVDLGNPGTSVVYANYTVPNIWNRQYYVTYNATRST